MRKIQDWINDKGLKFCLVNDQRGYKITLTFNLNNLFKIIGTDETYRCGSFCTGIETIGEKILKETKIFKVEYSYFQNYYYENFKDELNDKILNYFITGCSNYIFEAFCVEEPKISFEKIEVKENEEIELKEDNKYGYFDDDEDEEYIGEPYDFWRNKYCHLINYKLESFNLERDYYCIYTL